MIAGPDPAMPSSARRGLFRRFSQCLSIRWKAFDDPQAVSREGLASAPLAAEMTLARPTTWPFSL